MGNECGCYCNGNPAAEQNIESNCFQNKERESNRRSKFLATLDQNNSGEMYAPKEYPVDKPKGIKYNKKYGKDGTGGSKDINSMDTNTNINN